MCSEDFSPSQIMIFRQYAIRKILIFYEFHGTWSDKLGDFRRLQKTSEGKFRLSENLEIREKTSRPKHINFHSPLVPQFFRILSVANSLHCEDHKNWERYTLNHVASLYFIMKVENLFMTPPPANSTCFGLSPNIFSFVFSYAFQLELRHDRRLQDTNVRVIRRADKKWEARYK